MEYPQATDPDLRNELRGNQFRYHQLQLLLLAMVALGELEAPLGLLQRVSAHLSRGR